MGNIYIDTVYDNMGLKKHNLLIRKDFRNVYVYKDLDGKLIDFKAKNNVQLSVAVEDAINYLKLKKFSKEYILLFDGVNLIVSAKADKCLIEKKYNKILENKKISTTIDMN